MFKLLTTIAVVGLATQIGAGPAAAQSASCNAAMARLMDQWHAVGYATPEKPTQARVLGNDGHEATGQQVSYMHTQIELAAQECQQGDSAAALHRIASVSGMLDGEGVRTASRTGQ
jgi:hypothetical protein